MKVIFLDIDGVLITAKNSMNDVAGQAGTGNGNSAFDEAAIENLNKLIALTDARIVISSSIRFNYSISQLRSLLKCGGVKRPNIVDVTPFTVDPKTNSSHRGTEIRAWLSNHPEVTNFLVIDDCSDKQLTGIPRDRIVKTSYLQGFGDEVAYREAVTALHPADEMELVCRK